MALRRTLVPFLLFGVFALVDPSAYGQTVLNFPRVISNSTVFSGLAVSNPTPSDASVTFTAFAPDGTQFAATGVQNPVTLKIPAGGQAAKLSTEIFGLRDFNGWVQATSGSSGLTGFFLNGNMAETDLDGAGPVAPASDFILPFVSVDAIAKTEITVVNVNSDTANATITLYADDGTSVASKNAVLSGRGLLRQTLDTLFPNTDLSKVTHARVQADRPVIGHEVVADYALTGSNVRRETAALSGQQATAATSYVLPEFATGGGWLSLLGIVNAGGVGQQVTVTAYKEDGTVWNIPGNPKRLELEGNGAYRGTVGELFGFPAATLATGWIQVSSPLGYVSSYIAYGNTATPSFAVVAGTDATAGSQIEVFSQVAEGLGFFTGLTLVNPGTQDATLQFYTLRPDGTTVGSATLTVKPKQRIGELFTEILPSSLLQVGGWALVRSSQPLVAAVLFGSTNGYALANVPQQIPAGDFTPPAQVTGAINGTVRTGGAGVAGVQVALTGPVTTTTTTDDLGRYIFSQLPAGDYKVAPVRAGAQFAPASRSVTINKQNVDGADFDATGLTNPNGPAIQFLSPSSTFAGNASLNVRVLGANFAAASVVQINGQPAPTTFVNSAEVNAVVSSSLLKSAGTLLFTVVTPPPGGGASGAASFTVSPVPSNPLIEGRAGVGSFPAGVAIDTARGTALVTNQSSDSVTVLDLKTFQIKTSIQVGRSPAEGIAVHPGKNIALVANPGSNDVSVIDLQTNRETQRISVGRFPVGLAINASTNRAVVANANDDNVSIIDLNSLSVIGQIAVGSRPQGVAVDAASNKAVVTNSGSNDVSIIDLSSNTAVGKVGVGQFPRGVAISSVANVAVVANANSNDVSVVDIAGRTLLYTVKVETGPTGVAVYQATNTALITNSGVPRGSSDFSQPTNVSVLDIARRAISNSIAVGSAAFGIDVNQGTQEAVVADFGSNDVTVIRVPNPVPQVSGVSPKTVPAGGGAFTIIVSGSGFIPTAVVTVNGQPLPTTFVSATELHAEISAALLQQLLQVQQLQNGDGKTPSVAAAQGFLTINAVNPFPGGGISPTPSDPTANQISLQYGTPTLLSLAPTDATAGTGPIALTLNGNNLSLSSTVNFGLLTQLTPSSANGTSLTVTLPANVVASVYTVSVTNPGSGTSNSLTFTVNGTANPAPAVKSVTPSSVAAGSGSTTITVVGTGFVPGTTASLGSASGVVSGNTITFSLGASDTQKPGTLTGLITNKAPGGGATDFSVSVLNPVPTVTNFTPTSANAGSGAVALTVTGANFVSASVVTFAGTPVPTQFVSSTQLAATVPAPFLQNSGKPHVGVRNDAPGGGSADGGVFNVNSPIPAITQLSPSQIAVSPTPSDLTVTVTGTGFVGNSVAKAGALTLATLFNSATSLTITLPASLLSQGGGIDITVTNQPPGGGTSAAARFNVNNPVAVLTSVSPNQLRADQTSAILTAAGQNFVQGAAIVMGNTTLTTTFVSSTQLTAPVPSPLPLGKVNVVVKNPGANASNSVVVEITPLAPTITSVTPANVQPGQTIQVSGNNFGAGSVILLRGQAISTTVVSATSLTGTVPSGAALGAADVVVQNPATSTTAAQNSAAFTIQIVNPTPTITGLSPSSAAAGTTITITGTGFISSSQVTVDGNAVASAFVDSGTLTFVLPGTTGAQASIVVTNLAPGGGASNAAQLTVTGIGPVGPVITSLSPGSAQIGSSLTLTVNGSGFVSGATIMFNGSAVTTTFISSAALSAPITVPGTAGGVSVTVVNPGNVSSNAFTFSATAPPAPAITGLSPSTAQVGTALTLTVNGSGFASGATIIFNGSAVTTTFINSGSLSASITVPGTAGNVPVTVVNPGNVSSNTVSFVATAVPPPPNPAPTVTGVSPSSVTAGSPAISLTISGTNFLAISTVTFNGTGVTITSQSGTSLIVNVPNTLLANAATVPVTVTNPTPGGGASSQNFVIQAPPAPTLTGINPGAGPQGQAVPAVLTGTNFIAGATTINAPSGITVSAVSVTSGTSASATFNIAANAAPGAYNVSVTTAGGTSNTLTFTVQSSASFTVSGQTQSSGPISGGQRIIFSGTNFTAAPVSITFGGSMGSGAERLSSTQLAVYTPPHVAGVVNIGVTVGGSTITLLGAYSYNAGVSGTTFFQSPALTTARGDRPAAAFLTDGRWVVTGGTGTQGTFTTTLSSTDFSDPTTHIFTAGPGMQLPRALHTATALGDGRILIAGGASNGTTATNTTEILDAAGSGFTNGPSMSVARLGHTATLLADGRVLLAGGAGTVGGAALITAQIFDPITNTFGQPFVMTAARSGHTATLLPNGQVLFTGSAAGAEVFDPTTNAFSALAVPMQTGSRVDAEAAALTDGRVLITGGAVGGVLQAGAEIYNGTAFVAAGNAMPVAVALHSATLLQDGKVLIAGGLTVGGASPTSTAVASVFDPAGGSGAGTFGSAINLVQARREFASAPLPNGGVIFAGGNGSTLATAEIFGTPPTPVLQSVIPGSRVVGTGAFNMDVFGANFAANSTIVFNGTRYQPVTFIDSQHISLQIPANAIDSSKCAATPCSFNVVVSNPDPLNIGSFIDSAALPFAVVAPAISLSPNPAIVSIGGNVSVTVAVNQAPLTPIAISVISNDTSVATVSATANIPANQTTATVTLTGVAVGSTSLTASLAGYTSGNTTVTVTATPQPTVNITPPSIVLNAAGTDTITVTRVNADNSVPLNVALNVSRPGYVNIPANVTIPATQTAIVVPISGIAPDPTPPVIVTATASGLVSGSNTQISVQILQIQMTPALLVNPGSTVGLIITLSSPAPNSVTSPCTQPGLCVSLVSGATGTATVASPVLIPAGQTQGIANVTGVAAGNTTVTANAPGFPPVVSQIQVQNVNLSFVPGSATFFSGPNYAQPVTVIMSVTALAGGQTINLSSSDTTVATVPASVIIPSGATTVNVTVTGIGGGTATITASSPGLNSGIYTATVISPTLRIDDQETFIGTATGVREAHYVRISNTAPIGGIPVTITSSDPTKLLVAPCNTSNPQSGTCNDTNSPQSSITVSIPTGQNYAYFDVVGQDVALNEVRFAQPTGVARDSAGNVYIADYGAHTIRKIDAVTGIISTFAGNGTNTQTGDGGQAAQATVGYPLTLTIYNNELYIVSYAQSVIRKINLNSNIITTVLSSTISNPYQVVFNAAGDMFISSYGNSRIYRLSPGAAGGTLSVYAGGGGQGATTVGVQATALSLGNPAGLAVDAQGNVYYTDYTNHIVNQIATTGIVSRVTGNGTCSISPDSADAAVNGRVCYPIQLAYDASTAALYISDYSNDRVLRVTLNASEPSATPRPVTRIAGTPSGSGGCCGDGLASRLSSLNNPYGLAVDSNSNLLIADYNNRRIRQITMSTGIIDTLAGGGGSGTTGDGGPAVSTHLIVTAPNFVTQNMPVNIAQSTWFYQSVPTSVSTGVPFSVVVRANNSQGDTRMADATNVGLSSVTAGLFTVSTTPLTIPINGTSASFTATAAMNGSGQLQIGANLNGNNIRFASALSPVITALPVPLPSLTIDDSFAPQDTATGVRRQHFVRLPAVAGAGGVQVQLTVQGSGAQVSQCNPGSPTSSSCTGVAGAASTTVTVPANNNFAYFDLIGTAAAVTESRLYTPLDVAVDANGAIYVADSNNYRVRKLSGGVLTTVAGNGSSTPALGSGALTTALQPRGVAVDSSGNLYVAAYNGHVVYQVTPGGGIAIVAGTQNSCGNNDGVPGTGKLCSPSQVVIGPDNSLYIADYGYGRIRKIAPTSGQVSVNGSMTTIVGGGNQAPANGLAATSATFDSPGIMGMAIDASNGDVFFSDYSNQHVWKVAQSGAAAGQLVLVAGTGTAGYNGDQSDATLAQLYYPAHLAVSGSSLYIADQYNHRIRKVTTNVAPMPLVTVAGTTSSGYSGDGDAAIVSALTYPFGVTTDTAGNLFIADQNNQRIREVLASDGTMQTVIGNGIAGFAGDGGSGRGTTLQASVVGGSPNYRPVTIGVNSQQSQWQIVSISGPVGGTSQTTSSSFTFTARTINNDRMAADTAVNAISTAPAVMSIASTPLTITNNTQSVGFTVQTQSVAGNGQLQLQANGTTFLASALSPVITVLPVAVPSLTIDDSFAPQDTATGARRQHFVRLPAVAGAGGVQVQLTVQGSGAQVSQCNPGSPTSSSCTGVAGAASTTVTVPANNNFAYFDLIGTATAVIESRLYTPLDVAVDANGAIYVADSNNYRVRKLSGGVLTTVAGNGSSTPALGSGALTTALQPRGVAVDSAGNLYVAAYNGHVVYQVTPGGGIAIVAGTQNSCGNNDGVPGTGKLCSPSQVVVGPDNSLYIADYGYGRIRKIAPTSGQVSVNGSMTTIVGGGIQVPATGVAATSAAFDNPGIMGMAIDPANGDVYFSDYANHHVWKVAQSGAAAGQLVLVAGTGTAGYNGDQPDATQAQLNYPAHLAVSGTSLYIADQYNHRIRKVTTNVAPMPLVTVAGTTSAGYSGDGDAAIVSGLNYPFGVTTDTAGNLFIADQNNQRIREVLASDATMQTVIGNGVAGFAGDGGSGRGATLQASVVGGSPNYRPVTIGVNSQQSQWQIVSISGPVSGTSQTTSSSFTFTARTINNDRLAADTAVNAISTAPAVMSIASTPLTITNNTQSVGFTVQTQSVAGNGQLQLQANGTTFLASALSPVITVLPPSTPILTIDDSFAPQETATGVRQNHYVRLPATVTGAAVSVNLTSSDGSRVGLALCNAANPQSSSCTATTPTGAGITVVVPVNQNYAYFDLVGLTTPTADTRLYTPLDVAVDANGAIYVADSNNYRVRKLSGGVLTTVAGNGSSTPALGSGALTTAFQPRGVAVDSSGNLYVASYNGHVVYQVTPGGAITTVAGTQNSCGNNDGVPGTGKLCSPSQVVIGPDNSLYIADYSYGRIRKIAPSPLSGQVSLNGSMTTIVGGGNQAPVPGLAATSATFDNPGIMGVAIDASNGDVYFSDYANHHVWKVAQNGAAAGQLVLVAGTGTAGYNGDQPDATQAELNYPAHLSVSGTSLYIADQYNHRIRKVTTNVAPMPLVTVAGTTSGGYNGEGDLAVVEALNYPFGVTTDTAGNLFIADQNNQRIREVLALNATMQTVIGDGTAGFAGDGLGGRGVTITASIAPGANAPAYLPVSVGVNVAQSSWQVTGAPASTTGPGVGFTVSQTSPNGSNMRMNSDTTFSLTPNSANVLSVPSTLTILNNSTSVSPAAYSIGAIARSSNVVTVTTSTASTLSVGQIVGISGVTNTSFTGVFTITGVGTGTTFTYAQTGINAGSSAGTVSTAATIGSGTTQLIAQASSTGIALGATANIAVTPVFSAVSPNNGNRNAATPVTITGRNFLGATGITGPSGITGTITNVSPDGSTISATITVPSVAPTGSQTLAITTSTGNVNFSFQVN